MSVPKTIDPRTMLLKAGLTHTETLHYQCTPDQLVRDTLRLGEGSLSNSGALVIRTGEFTGRSPKDKFTVRDETTEGTVNWNEFNIPIDPENFETIRNAVSRYLEQCPEIWVRDCHACADPRYRLRIRVVTEKPWSNLFAYNMFLRPDEQELEGFEPDWIILNAPGLRLDPAACGTRQHNASVISFKHRLILIAGSGYTGEIKKGIFTVLNYVLPHEKKVLSMHCSANCGPNGDTAIFFGLSGTGKTTLSADPERKLIGDDEHGWTADNIFNFEGGCYAKTIQLSEEKEPDIYHAIRNGALVENTVFHPGTDQIDFDAATITENTRVSYPLSSIRNAQEPSVGAIPKHIFFLTCDAFGVLPPLSRLTPGQAMYQFISGYTAKVAGTEAGVTEPKPTFSACFGAPFLPLHPGTYAQMLGEKMRSNEVQVWMVNTGWTGGPFGTGHRMKLSFTRAMIAAVLGGRMEEAGYMNHPVFGMAVPDSCPGVPAEVLDPRKTWDNPAAYDEKARYLAGLFATNFEKYAAGVTEEIRNAGPLLT